MPTITSAGVGSGLDLENLISEITRLEREPKENRFAFREATIQAEISAFGALQSAMDEFRSSLSSLGTLSQFSTRTATVSSSEHFSASASSSAVPGQHDIEVLSTAVAHRLVSAGVASSSAPIGNGTLTIAVGTDSFSVDIDDAENDTIFGIRDAINEASDNTGVTASTLYVDDGGGGYEYRLVLQSDNPGEDNELTVTVSGDGDGDDTDNAGLSSLAYDVDSAVTHLTELDAVSDAQIRVDTFLVTQSSNTFADVIPGVTIEALDADVGNSHTLTIGTDTTAAMENIQAVVDAYNQLNSTIRGLTEYNADTQQGSVLSGDATVRTIESTLRRVFTREVDGVNASFDSLSSIGITTGDEGVLVLSSATLTSALNNNFDEVAQLFTADDALVDRVDEALGGFLDSGGVFATKRTTYQEQIADIAEAREALDFRVSSIETRLRRQFSAMDILISNLNQTGSFVQEQLELTAAALKREK